MRARPFSLSGCPLSKIFPETNWLKIPGELCSGSNQNLKECEEGQKIYAYYMSYMRCECIMGRYACYVMFNLKDCEEREKIYAASVLWVIMHVM